MKNIKAFVLLFFATISMLGASNAFAETYLFSGELNKVDPSFEDHLSVGDPFDFILDGDVIKTTSLPFADRWSIENFNSPLVDFGNGLLITAESASVRNIAGYDFEIYAFSPAFSGSAVPGISSTRLSLFTTGGSSSGVPIGSSLEDVLKTQTTLVIAGGNLAGDITYIGAVPEPSSYALLLAGLGLLFFRKAKNNRL